MDPQDNLAQKTLDYIVPFNIVLQGKDQDAKINETAYFHLINSKSVKLTSEENLKSIFDGNLFTDVQIKELLGENALKAKALFERLQPIPLHGIADIISNRKRSFCLECLNLDQFDMQSTKNIVKSIQNVDILLSDAQYLNKVSFNLALAFIYIKCIDETKYSSFTRWICDNQLFDIAEVETSTLLSIFYRVYEKEIKIFIAMPYFENNPDIIEEYNIIYRTAINRIAEQYKINVSNFPIMTNEGATQDQIQDIINKIKRCNLFIGDITNNNANVTYEIGYARGLGKKVILVKEKDSEAPKSDYANDTYHEYNEKALNLSLSNIVTTNIIAALELTSPN